MHRHRSRTRGTEGRWRIGELATHAGTTARAIRLYHAEGLLSEPERSEAGYRLYGSADLAGLIRVRRLRSLGFTIDQVRELIAVARPAGLAAALAELRADLDQRISQLRAAEAHIDQLRGEDPSERLLYERLASVLRKALASGKDMYVDGPELSPLGQRLKDLHMDVRWAALSDRLRSLRDSPATESDVERLANDLATVVPAELLPDQLADPLIPTLLLGARFSRQQIEALHRAAEIKRAKRRRRK